MILTYSDGLGYVEIEVTEDGVDFLDRIAYFDIEGRLYAIPIENLVSIRSI